MINQFSQNHKPIISVVMASYNGEKYLKSAVESILSQSFRDFEFLIVNDGSTDSTGEVLRRFAQQDDRIKIIDNVENIGLTKSLNKAMAIARGDYIARMDDDDISLPHRFQKQLEFMEKNPSFVLCGCMTIVIDERGEEISRKKIAIEYQDIKKKLLFNNQFMHSALFFRKDEVRPRPNQTRSDLVLYDESFERAQDYELVLRIAGKYQVANIPEYLLKWRKTKTSLSFSGAKQQRCAIKARWWAITKYGYPKIAGIFHIIARIGWLAIPQGIKQKLK